LEKTTILVPPTRVVRLAGDLNFGAIEVGQSAYRTLTIFNDGNVPLTVTAIDFPTNFSGAWSGVIAPTKAQQIQVVFAPAQAQSYAGHLIVSSDYTAGSATLAVSGIGRAIRPELAIRWANQKPEFILRGSVGGNYGIQYLAEWHLTNYWQDLLRMKLSNSTALFSDSSGSTSLSRFYRALRVETP
jgi:hypothetical protein